MVRTWRRELGLAREKQSTTTSDLRGKKGKEKKVFIFLCIYNITKEITDKMGKYGRGELICCVTSKECQQREDMQSVKE